MNQPAAQIPGVYHRRVGDTREVFEGVAAVSALVASSLAVGWLWFLEQLHPGQSLYVLECAPAGYAAIAALGATLTGRPVRGS